MVAELDITDQDVTKIAEMIDDEIASLVPEWRNPIHKTSSCCYLQDLQCSKHGCGSMHGRFEEIMERVERVEHSEVNSITNGEIENDLGNKNDENAPNARAIDPSTLTEDYENVISQELRWLKAKYQMQLRELRDQQLGVVPRPTNLDSDPLLGHSLHRASSLPVDATDV